MEFGFALFYTLFRVGMFIVFRLVFKHSKFLNLKRNNKNLRCKSFFKIAFVTQRKWFTLIKYINQNDFSKRKLEKILLIISKKSFLFISLIAVYKFCFVCLKQTCLVCNFETGFVSEILMKLCKSVETLRTMNNPTSEWIKLRNLSPVYTTFSIQCTLHSSNRTFVRFFCINQTTSR